MASRCTNRLACGRKFPETANKFADAIRAADGVVIVSPEYNYTIPGAFKNAVDWVRG